jgi:mono/diheme cytochrome c family protein
VSARRWLVGTAAGLALVTACGFAWVWFASEAHLHSFARPAAFAGAIPTDAASIAHGEHLVHTRGCRGCHGPELQGELKWGYAVAPNLPKYVRAHDAAVFEAALRHGIAADGSALYSMPSYNFKLLRDSDVADIYAYLRTLAVSDIELPPPSLPWSIRWNLARGSDRAIAGFLSLVPPLKRANDPDPRMARGEYLAMTTCNECHGFGLRADSPFPDGSAPDLIVIAAYDEPTFTHLMRTGKAIGERELPMMSGVARGRFVHFTDEEVQDLYSFLSDMAAQAAATPAVSARQAP